MSLSFHSTSYFSISFLTLSLSLLLGCLLWLVFIHSFLCCAEQCSIWFRKRTKNLSVFFKKCIFAGNDEKHPTTGGCPFIILYRQLRSMKFQIETRYSCLNDRREIDFHCNVRFAYRHSFSHSLRFSLFFIFFVVGVLFSLFPFLPFRFPTSVWCPSTLYETGVCHEFRSIQWRPVTFHHFSPKWTHTCTQLRAK